MKNLQIKSGDKEGRYVYRTAKRPEVEGEEVEAIAIEIYYSRGGTNMFSGGGEPRGIWLSINPVTLTRRGTAMLLGDVRGVRAHLVTLKMASDKKLVAVATVLDDIMPEAGEIAVRDGSRAAVTFIKTALAAADNGAAGK